MYPVVYIPRAGSAWNTLDGGGKDTKAQHFYIYMHLLLQKYTPLCTYPLGRSSGWFAILKNKLFPKYNCPYSSSNELGCLPHARGWDWAVCVRCLPEGCRPHAGQMPRGLSDCYVRRKREREKESLNLFCRLLPRKQWAPLSKLSPLMRIDRRTTDSSVVVLCFFSIILVQEWRHSVKSGWSIISLLGRGQTKQWWES